MCIGAASATELTDGDSDNYLPISDSNQDLSDDLVIDDSASLSQSSESSSDSDVSEVGNQASNSKVLTADVVGEGEHIWYVGENITENGDGSEENPFNNLKLAIENAGENDVIKVNNGIYNGSNNTGLKITKNGLSIIANGDDVKFYPTSNRFFNITANDTLIKGITFANCSGNGFNITGNRSTIDSCTFINSTGLRITGNNNTLNNSKFIGGSNSGISAYFSGGDNVINNTVFNNTYSQALSVNGQRAIVENSNFTNCSRRTSNDGGAIYLSASSSRVNNCNFNNNKGYEDAGAIEVNSAYNNITNCNFTNNSAYSGGAIYLKSGNNVIDNCNFINNNATRYGGGAIIGNTFNNVSNSNFTNNSAHIYGGALSLARLNVENCNFTNNSALYGGAIYTVYGNVSNSKFENNAGELEGLEKVAILAINNITQSNNQGLDEINQKTYIVGEDVTSPTSVSYNQYLSNGYRSYCIEYSQHIPNNGFIVNVTDETFNRMGLFHNSLTGEYIFDYIKILVYLAETTGNKSSQQSNIWSFTDNNYRSEGQYSNGTYKNNTIGKVLELYDSGFRVNDTNVIIDENGNKILLDIKASISFAATQNLLLYKLVNNTVNKETLNKTVIAGDIVEYRITVTNNGTGTSTGIFVIDKYSADELEYVGYANGTGKWTFIPEESKWILNGSLARNKSVDFIVYFKTKTNGTFINNVTSGQDDIVLSESGDKVTVLDYDLVVEKNTLDPVVYMGGQTRFEIIVRNTGQLNQTNVTVIEDDYEGLVYDSFIGDDWTHSVNNDGKHQFKYSKTLEVGETASFIVVFNAPIPGNFTNIVIASSDNNTTEACNNTTVYNSSLDVQKIALNSSVPIGEETQFRIVVTNTGEIPLEGVFVEETKYEGLEYVRFIDQSGKWSYDGKKMWTYEGVLDSGESIEFIVVFKTLKEGNFTNIITVGSDNTSSNKTANDTVEVFKKIENNTENSTENSTEDFEEDIVKSNDVIAYKGIQAGNPIMILILALIMLVIPLGRKK